MEDKVAVVTGGSRGMGREICHDFARRGFRVVVASRVGRVPRSDHRRNAVADARTGGRDTASQRKEKGVSRPVGRVLCPRLARGRRSSI
jgi:NAD(P)-dependent dehydrogenase (short-subunit alcohol dehydrogenase family)